MKNLILYLNIIFLMFTVSACQSEEDKAASVAKEFLELCNEWKFEEAKKLCDDRTAALLGMAQSMASLGNQERKEIKLSVVKSVVQGDIADVVFKDELSGKEDEVRLVKIDGVWKVSMEKDSMNKDQ